MDRYDSIKKRLLQYAQKDSEIKGVISFGSSTRKEAKADAYSDLDLMIVTENVERWYSDEYPSMLGDVSISFIEPTLGGGKERRCIYDDSLDVDMIIFTPEQFEKALVEGVASWVLNRGYAILYDACDYETSVKKYVSIGSSQPDMNEEEYTNMVNDFFFHNIWALKKLQRGELWSAKMCVDGYLKNYLLKMMELYRSKIDGMDVWHDGRFIDKWAGEEISKELKDCFSHYEKEDIRKALLATHTLFVKLARKIAEEKGYSYPDKAETCAKRYLELSGPGLELLGTGV